METLFARSSACLRSGLSCLRSGLAGLALVLASAGQAQPVNPIWAGEWRVADSNLPPPAPSLAARRDVQGRVSVQLQGADCALVYDGLVPSAAIVQRIEERARWQLTEANWPAGTDTSQLVGLRREFDQALRIARLLPPDSYRRVRATCPEQPAPAAGDRFFVLNEGRRLFEFRFPDNDLSLRVTLYERVR